MPYKFDPEVAEAMAPMMAMQAQAPPVAVHDVETRRKNFDFFLADVIGNMPVAEGVTRKVFKTKTADGHDLEMTWFSPTDAPASPGPALLHTHGGGMILGSVTGFAAAIHNTVAESGVPMLSVEYRYAPEHPHPTPLEDCYTGLVWLQDHAKELNVDPARIGVMGESAGGGLAAGLALMARDRKFSPPLAKQVLIYPMIDDRNTDGDKEMLPFCIWSYEDNITGWSALLGKDVIGTDRVSKYAAPARETDLSNLPPAYIDVGELDIFRGEDIEYARKLATAKVSTEFHLHPGCPHAFEALAPNSDVVKRAMTDRVRAIKSF
jgi:acetyl esterase/lipase